MISIIHHPDGNKRLGDLLTEHFESQQWSSFRAAIAFAKRSGTKHITARLREFTKRGNVKLSLGIDQCGTSFEGATDLLSAIGNYGELWLFHNEISSHPTFHPQDLFLCQLRRSGVLRWFWQPDGRRPFYQLRSIRALG
jgi:hypothetical protein